MSRHEELPNRFKRSRSPSREIPPQFGRPAQYGKVVIVLSDSEEDGMSMSDRTSPEPPQDPARAGIGTAHPPPQGTAGAGAGANMDMTTPTREVGKAYPLPHRPAPGPHGKLQQKKQKKGKPHYACSYCHSNQHTNIHCPHKDANLSSRALKALKMANRLDVKEDREALQAALALSVQGLQIPTGPKVAIRGNKGARYSSWSGTFNGAVAQPKLARNPPLSCAAQVHPGPQSGAIGYPVSQPMPATDPPIACAAPANPHCSYQAQLHPGPQPGAAYHGAPLPKPASNPFMANAALNPFSSQVHTGQSLVPPARAEEIPRLGTEQNKIAHQEMLPVLNFGKPSTPAYPLPNCQPVVPKDRCDKLSRLETEVGKIGPQEPILGLNFVKVTAPKHNSSSYKDQVHPDRRPFVAERPDEFTRLKTEREKIAQLQELVPSISFVNARNALLMHRWDLSLAFEMAGVIEDKKLAAVKAGHGTKQAVQEWEAEHLDDQGPQEVKKARIFSTSALPKTGYEHLERRTLDMSNGGHLGQGENVKWTAGNEMRTALLGAHQYSGAQGENMRYMATTEHHPRGNKGDTNRFLVEDAYGTHEMPAYKSSTHLGEKEYLDGMGGPFRPAEHSYKITDTAGTEDIESILRRLIHK